MKKIIVTFANFLSKYFSRSEAFRLAYRAAKENSLHIVRFVLKSTGKATTRIVSESVATLCTLAGGKSCNAPGQILYVDMVKFVRNEPRTIISTFLQNIEFYL
jgi:3-dehydroquinate dehydratase